MYNDVIYRYVKDVQYLVMPLSDLEPYIDYRLGLTIYNGIRKYSSQRTIKIHCHILNLKQVISDVWYGVA